MTVDLFITCLNDALFPRTGIATVRVLERLGHTVRFNPEQTCCGQMHFNSGAHAEALPLIRRFIEVFENAEAIVSPSGSCVAMVREFYPKAAEWAGDAALRDKALAIAAKTYELSEFLVNRLKVEDVGASFPYRVTYHPACHSLRTLNLGDAPIRLLQKVNGLTLCTLKNADQCCGFGGTFSLKNAETSVSMMLSKCEAVERSDAEYCCAVDRSCLMQIGGGLSRRHSRVKVIHLAEILASEGRA